MNYIGNIPVFPDIVSVTDIFGGDLFDGYLQDLRITAVARYTEDFTPPTRIA